MAVVVARQLHRRDVGSDGRGRREAHGRGEDQEQTSHRT